MYPAFSDESRLISSGWKEWLGGSADVPCVLGRESANLIGLEGAAKVIPNEADVRYIEMERVDHLEQTASEYVVRSKNPEIF